MVLRNFACLGILLTLLCAWPAERAKAQAWLSDRARAEGHGFKLGALELHPGVGAEGGWQNNVFNNDPGNGVQAAGLLRVSPHLYLSTRRARAVESEAGGQHREGPPVSFRAGVTGSFMHYFAAYDRTDMAVGADLQLKINEGRVFSVILDENFKRDIRPFGQPAFSSPDIATAQAVSGSNVNFGRDQNTVGVTFQLASPGDLLKGSLGYAFGFDLYEDAAFDVNDNLTHTVKERVSWTFLPKTALFQQMSVAFQSYGDGSSNAVSSLNDNKRVETEVGINGALTPAVGLTIAAGYGAGFFDNDVDLENFMARVEGRWTISKTVKASLGYRRAFQSTFQGNFARTDAIRGDVAIAMGGVFLLRPIAGVTFVDFGPSEGDRGQDPRNDIYLDLGVSGEYRVIDWLAFTAEANYTQNFSSYEFRVPDPNGGPQTVGDPVKYQSGEVWLGVRAFY